MRFRTELAAIALVAATAAACSSSPDDGGTGATGGKIQVTASGEALGQQGFAFPPGPGDEAYFVDGWSVKLTGFYVTIDSVTLSDGPDTSPTDPLQTGSVVAEAKGPWAVNLAKGGPLPGKGGDDQAIAITVLENQNKNGGKPFAEDTRYAFGFRTAAATAAAQKLSFDAEDEANYQEMVQKGYVVLYVGTAEHKGTTCTPTGDASVGALPTKVNFRFGFTTPVSYTNCVNPDFGEETRGVQVKANAETVAQITMHADHPFWDAYEEDAPLRFDTVALVASTKATAGGATPVVTLEDFKGVPLAPVTAGGKTVTARVCAPGTGASGSPLALESKGESFADVYALMTALQRTQGHLNADGLCAVPR